MAEFPRLTTARSGVPATLDLARNSEGGFDVDAFHAMNERDDQLIADEVINGAGSAKFVYKFRIAGTEVSGVSVIGARQLAYHYGGLQHRMISSVQKSGSLFTFTSFPAPGMPMMVDCRTIHELASEPDFYQVLIEITDIKKGNSVQVERRENREETRQDGSKYERPNFATIAQSKAYRNGVLGLVPQNVTQLWKAEMLKIDRNSLDVTESVIEQKRSGIRAFALKHNIPLLTDRVGELTMDTIAALSDKARDGVPAFARAAMTAGLVAEGTEMQQQALPAPTAEPTKPKRQAKQTPAEVQAQAQADPRAEETSQAQPAAETVVLGDPEPVTALSAPVPTEKKKQFFSGQE